MIWCHRQLLIVAAVKQKSNTLARFIDSTVADSTVHSPLESVSLPSDDVKNRLRIDSGEITDTILVSNTNNNSSLKFNEDISHQHGNLGDDNSDRSPTARL
jgi:hypothetical protein